MSYRLTPHYASLDGQTNSNIIDSVFLAYILSAKLSSASQQGNDPTLGIHESVIATEYYKDVWFELTLISIA